MSIDKRWTFQAYWAFRFRTFQGENWLRFDTTDPVFRETRPLWEGWASGGGQIKGRLHTGKLSTCLSPNEELGKPPLLCEIRCMSITDHQAGCGVIHPWGSPQPMPPGSISHFAPCTHDWSLSTLRQFRAQTAEGRRKGCRLGRDLSPRGETPMD